VLSGDKHVQEKSGLRLCIFVVLVASASLGFELLQTRVLSALYFNNVVYMTVTIALLGYGISGVLSSLLYHRIVNPDRIAAYCAAGMAISMLFSIYVASSLPAILQGIPALYKMILSYFLLVIPFLFSGGALSLIFMSHGKDIFGLYFLDLVASALVIVLFGLLLWPVGGPNFVWICAAVSLSAFLLQLPRGEINRKEIICFIAILGVGYFLTGQKIINNQPELYKSTARFYSPHFDAKREATAWTNIAKIDVYSDKTHDLHTGQYTGHPSTYKYIAQDNDAPTMIHGEKDIAYFKEMKAQGRPTEVNTLAYFMKPNPQNVLVIGVGGGVDVVEARTYGAQNIDGVEINAATIDFVTKRFRDYAKWPSWKNINVYHSEGRHFIRSTLNKYDVIVMHGVDTFSALNSGAYVLSENYLYTVEAIKDYLKALKPHGMMVIYRWFFLQPRESIRLANLFVEAAATEGEGPASQRIMVINHGLWAGTFIKREPFTPEEIESITKLIHDENYAWVYVPKVLAAQQKSFEASQFKQDHDKLSIARKAYEALITAPDLAAREAFERAYPYKIDPVYDDKPFFFEYYKGRESNLKNENWPGREDASQADFNQLRGPVVHYVLYMLLFITTGVCGAGMGIPLICFNRKGIHIPRASGLVGFFASLGIGFMFVEIGCMQWLNLYLGAPMYALMVVLSGLLFFAGTGSFIASKLSPGIEKKLHLGMLGTVVMIPLWLLIMKFAMPLSEHWSFGWRIIVVLFSLLPLGLCMGIPFASGLRYLADYEPRFIPWAWGINGLTSVAASILAIILAMQFGFTWVIISASFVYLAGYFSLQYYLGTGFVHHKDKMAQSLRRKQVSILKTLRYPFSEGRF
jgi:spermidine synthase